MLDCGQVRIIFPLATKLDETCFLPIKYHQTFAIDEYICILFYVFLNNDANGPENVYVEKI